MKTTVTICSYWCSPSSEKHKPDPGIDYLFDHATPLDEEGTLAAALDSLKASTDDRDLTLAVVAVPSHREIYQAVQLKVESILSGFDFGCPTYLIGPDQLAFWRRRLALAARDESHSLLSFAGYSNVGNICLLVAWLTGAESIVMLDDCMLVDDPNFINQAVEYIGKGYMGETVSAVAGVQDSQITVTTGDGAEALSPAVTACGGPLVIHRSLFEQVPFDPLMERGVDTDYLINARLCGHKTFRDRQVLVDRIETILCSPAWYRMRKEAVRLFAEKCKLAGYLNRCGPGEENGELSGFHEECLYGEKLSDRIFRESLEMAFEYLEDGKEENAGECITNIALCRSLQEDDRDWLGEYMDSKERWCRLLSALDTGSSWPAMSTTD